LSEDIAAYLDGELDAEACASFEVHLTGCQSCSAELQEQRRLLCALDFALGADDPNLALPRNFAQVVAAHAESDMSGVRSSQEHGRALRLCLGLSLVVFILLGGARLSGSVLIPLRAVARYVLSVGGLVWNALYDAGSGMAVILRALGRRFVFESHPFSLLAFLLFALLALALLPRLIARYHRAEITE
jgi:hypothetical protein